MSETLTLPAPIVAADPGLSVTRNVTPPVSDHHSRTIGDPEPLTSKERKAMAFIESGFYELDDVLEASLDPLALELGLDRVPVRDWLPGDVARLETPSGRYLVEVAQVHRIPETAVDAASVRVVTVLDASPVSGLGRGAEGQWPLTSLHVADAA